MIQSVAIVGAGNLAWSLIPALQAQGLAVAQLISRSRTQRQRFQQQFAIPHGSNQLGHLEPEVDAVFLCVPDQAITEVAQRLPPTPAMRVHASGATPLQALQTPAPAPMGVFYPLQTFTLDRRVDMGSIPLFVEGSDARTQDALLHLAQGISRQAIALASPERLRLHAGAVFASNFPNLLYQVAEAQLPAGLGFEVYEPLVREQVRKAATLGPRQSQTGPARRGDLATIQQHLRLLQETPHWQQLYRQLSQLINEQLALDE